MQDAVDWTILETFGCLSGYCWLPLSCCFRNPVAVYIYRNRDATHASAIAENLALIVAGFIPRIQ